MKKNYLLLIFCFITYFTNAQAPFITTWDILGGDTIIVPIIEDDDVPDSYTIDFGDGTVLTNQSGNASHTYINSGIYTVTISGNFTRIKFGWDNPDSSSKLLTIEQWGDIQWTSMIQAFYNCSNLTITATDTPDLSQVTDISYMFSGCSSLNQSINNWDVSSIINISYAFRSCSSFNQPLNNWDVSSVTAMVAMFYDAESFNQPLDNWDVSNVEYMGGMFKYAESFNQSLDNWNVSSVTNMQDMFYGANSFDQPLNNWDVSSVTTMENMFISADSFNQPLNNWDVSNVTDMSYMFFSADSFNQPLNNWDVSNVTVIYRMFSNAGSFNQPLNNWNVSGVTNMDGMFDSAVSFNQSLNSWDVSNVTDMTGMFGGATSFNQPLNNWDVSGVTRMDSMFLLATSFNQPLDNWDVSNVTNMRQMFYIATSFNQDISTWNFNENVTFSIPGSFVRSSGLDVNNYDALLNRFVELELENKWLDSGYLEYCDIDARNYLINELGWVIEDDSLAEDCTAVTESFTKYQLSIYPNPVNDILYIETKLGVQLEAVTIYNLQGSQLIQQSQDFDNINTESLSSGIYILNIQTDKGSAEYKLIKN